MLLSRIDASNNEMFDTLYSLVRIENKKTHSHTHTCEGYKSAYERESRSNECIIQWSINYTRALTFRV